jgi:hypothetical protein
MTLPGLPIALDTIVMKNFACNVLQQQPVVVTQKLIVSVACFLASV